MNDINVSRRRFLQASAITGGGMLLQLSMPGAIAQELGTLIGSRDLNAYVKIASDGQITIYAATPEMGQGVRTSLPMIIAEEMGAKWEDVVIESAPIDSATFGMQGAGGSRSIPGNFDAMRQMGASAREMLIGAASESMELPREELEAKESQVVHKTGRRLTFGQLAALAVKQPVPDPSTLVYKDPESYGIIGTSVASVDNLVIATGRSKFGIDTQVPGMKYAVYESSPRPGSKVVSFNEAEIKSMPGIIDAFKLDRDESAGRGAPPFLAGLNVVRAGVAIVGDDTWSVFDAKSRLSIKWDDSEASHESWSEMVPEAKRIAREEAGETIREADVDPVFADSSNKTAQAFYQFPFVAHLCMEPMNCTAHFARGQAGKPDTMEVWLPSQFPEMLKQSANAMFDIPAENVVIHGTRMGGGFGRRAIHDFACEAMAISHRVAMPVKLTWTRTDDIHHDYFRVGGFEQMKGAVDKSGKLVGWDQHYIGFSRGGSPVIGSGLRGQENVLSAMQNARVRQSLTELATLCGPWRAPGSNTNAFVEQCFLHELAELAGRDHLEFLVEVMGERRWTEEGNIGRLHTGRAIDVIQLAATEAGWGKKMPKGKGLGLAFYFSHSGHIAEVAEVSVDANRNLHVDKVTVAVDIGPIINMSGATTQVQGSVIDGLSTMALQEVTMEDGIIQQDNLHEYPVARIGMTPEVDVHFIQSDNRPTGIGEPALPPLAPAVANAIFAATGIRVRSMPLIHEGFTLV